MVVSNEERLWHEVMACVIEGTSFLTTAIINLGTALMRLKKSGVSAEPF